MITLIIKKTGFVMSSVLWGIMAFLISGIRITRESPRLIFNAVQDFRNMYDRLSPPQQESFGSLLKYDNLFVLLFGIFLMAYAFDLRAGLVKKQKAKKFRGVLILPLFALLYMASDWTENYIFKQAIHDPGFTWEPFKWLQYGKWALGLITLVALITIDLLALKNRKSILTGAALSVILILITYVILT